MNVQIWWEIGKIALAIIIPLLGGMIGGLLSAKSITDWYTKLVFPPFRPPNWLFAPAWTVLYICMGCASYLVWRNSSSYKKALLPLGFYVVQLILNWAWSPIFFIAHEVTIALIDIIALTAVATATGVLFYNVNKVAGYLFIPYIGWLCFATVLNASILKLNPDFKSIDKAE